MGKLIDLSFSPARIGGSLRYENDWQKRVRLLGLTVPRGILWWAALVLLMLVTVWCWNHRYESAPGQPVLTLADLRKHQAPVPAGVTWEERPSIRLRIHKEAGEPHVLWVLPLASLKAMEALHVRTAVRAQGLRVGNMPWDDGRILIQWQSGVSGANEEIDPVSSARDDQEIRSFEQVARPDSGNARAVLRLEHLGARGDFLIKELELTPVRATALWRKMEWLLPLLWLALVLAALWRRRDPGRVLRPVLAAGLWLLVILIFAVPGPWKSVHPIFGGFSLAGPAAKTVAVSPPAPTARPVSGTSTEQPGGPPANTSAPEPAPVQASGRILPNGGWLVALKMKLTHARPLLHMLLLFLPTLCFAMLLDPKRAMWLGLSIMLAIELAQVGFGFGFDRIDAMDLLTDATGIFAALWVHKRWIAPHFKRDASASDQGGRPARPAPLQ